MERIKPSITCATFSMVFLVFLAFLLESSWRLEKIFITNAKKTVKIVWVCRKSFCCN
jgi:hypothetical protein